MVSWVDTSKYSGADFLIVRVAWNPAGRLVYEVQNRTQTWLDLNVVSVAADAATTPTTLFRETTAFWINSEETTTPAWLGDGSFLWLSGRSGFTHAYHYAADGALLKQVTTGRWELRTLHGVDEKDGWIYFSGTERSPIGGDVYRVRIDGSGLERLSKAAGTHRAEFSPGFGFFIDRWSDVSSPPQVRLHRSDGRDVRTLHENRVDALAGYRLSKPEFVQVKARDGFVMEAMMIKPPDFDPSQALSRLPVHVRRPAQPGSEERLAAAEHVSPAAGAAGHHRVDRATTAPPAARGSSPRGRCSGTSARSSSATSRTASAGSSSSATWTGRASASTGGATAAS